MAQQSAFEYLSHGLTPFFRLPSHPVAALAEQGMKKDVVLLGVPYDGGVTYQPGARMAPYHVRRTSAFVQGYHPVHEIDVFESLACVDGGNIATPPFNAAMTREIIFSTAKGLASAGVIPLVLGGDHSITLPLLQGIHAAHGPVALIHVDAHLDTSDSETWGEDFHHGTPIRHAIDKKLIERGQLYQLGIRATRKDSSDDKRVRGFGGKLWSVDDYCSEGPQSVLASIRNQVGDRPVYLSFDIDAVDPGYAPGTGTPVPGGFTSRESLELVRGLAGLNVVGMDLVEVAPNLDVSDMTCHLAAHLLYEMLALAAMVGKK